MSTVSFNLGDIYSDDDLKAIARREVEDYFRENRERLIGNAVYRAVGAAVDSIIEDDPALQAEIGVKTAEVVGNLSSYNVFKPGDRWEWGPSTGWKLLEAAVADRADAIGARVDELIAEQGYESIRSLVVDAVGTLLSERRGSE